MPNVIVDRIKLLLRENDSTLKQLAKGIKRSEHTIYSIMKRQTCDEDTAKDIATYLNCDASYITHGNSSERLGALIKKKRIQNGLTQEQLAKALNTTKAAISRYERGQRTPNAYKYALLCNALDMDINTILYLCKDEDGE